MKKTSYIIAAVALLGGIGQQAQAAEEPGYMDNVFGLEVTSMLVLVSCHFNGKSEFSNLVRGSYDSCKLGIVGDQSKDAELFLEMPDGNLEIYNLIGNKAYSRDGTTTYVIDKSYGKYWGDSVFFRNELNEEEIIFLTKPDPVINSESGQEVIEQPKGVITSNKNQAWLDAHNAYRKKHQVDALVWSDEIAKSAQTYADTCILAHSDSSYGENIAFSTRKQNPDNVVLRWYEEVNDYDFGTHTSIANHVTGHFTQVVWKNTMKLGCAQASSCSGTWKDIVICQYDPPGNYIGQHGDNVFPIK